MTEPSAAPKPAPEPLDRGVFLPRRGLSVARTLLAVGGAVAALSAIALGHRELGAFGWVEVGLLGAALVAMLLDRVDAHVFVRSVLWGVLIYGAIDVMDHSHAWSDLADRLRGYTVLFGAAGSLLSLGRAGLDGEHGSFFPIVMRRSLLTMMVVGLGVAHVLAVLAVVVPDGIWSMTAAALVTPALLVVSVAGLSRTRSWGLFAYLGALLACGGSLLLFASPPEAWNATEVSYISRNAVLFIGWALGGSAVFAAGLPVLFALIVKPRPKPAGKGWGQHVHAALVLGVVGLTVYGALT